MLLLGSIRSIMIICIKIDDIFRKPTRPSLPLRKAPPFSPSLSSIVFTPPSVPPVLGDRNPQGREDVTALRCSEPLRYKVGGPSKVYAMFCGMGPPGDELGLSLDRLAYKDGYNDYMMLVLW